MADDTESSDNRGQRSSKAITECFNEVSVGDRLILNNRETAYEVVNVDRYSVTVSDPNGGRLSIVQNLQSGGWVISEDVWWVASAESEKSE